MNQDQYIEQISATTLLLLDQLIPLLKAGYFSNLEESDQIQLKESIVRAVELNGAYINGIKKRKGLS